MNCLHHVNHLIGSHLASSVRPEEIPVLPVAAAEKVGTGAEKMLFLLSFCYMSCTEVIRKSNDLDESFEIARTRLRQYYMAVR